MEYLKYNTDEFPFRSIAEEQIFSYSPLETIHNVYDTDLLTRETDQGTVLHKMFYKNIDLFLPTYVKFINTFIKSYLNSQVVYQAIPAFRVQLPNNLAVGERHRDTDYGHSDSEINFLLPLTMMHRSNSVYIEHGKDLVWNPSLSVGELFTFDGNHYHFNTPNQEESTRVSIDFRVIKINDYHASTNKSINVNKAFVVGEYFEVSE